ncbi:hypothetical protein TNCV_1462281 [Trichonephila clavipes]|nr:hypothetical protein TNCV_1462281 [Trichonephila clavipes]
MRSKTVLITREKVSTAQIPGNPVNKSFSKHLPRAEEHLMYLAGQWKDKTQILSSRDQKGIHSQKDTNSSCPRVDPNQQL